jgi:hypothetical protein
MDSLLADVDPEQVGGTEAFGPPPPEVTNWTSVFNKSRNAFTR